MCSVHFCKRLELKLHLVASMLESVSRSLFPPLFPLLLKGLLELVFPLVFCSLHVSSSFFFVSSFQLQRGHGLFFIFFLQQSISGKSVLLFSGASVWPWQLLETELSHPARARATGNILPSISSTQPANPLRCFHRQRKESRITGLFFLHLYTNMHLNCLVSSHTAQRI